MISSTRYQLRLETNRQMKLSAEIGRLQAQISSGKRLLAPSDDPGAAARISDIARSQANQETWRANLDKASALSAQADGVLKALGSAFTRASELMLAGASTTLSAADRGSIALEIDSIAEEVATLRMTRDSRGELLFPTGPAIRIPVGADLELAGVGTRAAVFDTVVTPSGTSDLVSILTAAASALRSGGPAVATAVDQVNAASTHVFSAHAEQGARGSRIDTLIDQAESFKITMAEERVGIESADIPETIAKLQAHELSLEAAQAAFARINRQNLFDLLS